MKKDEAILMMKSRCYAYLKKYTNEKNEDKIQMFTTISNLLEKNDSFKTMETGVAFKILKDLGFDTRQSIEIYRELIK